MSFSLGAFLICFLTVFCLLLFTYYIIYVKREPFDKGMRFLFVVIALILVRMLVPVNFPFTVTVSSRVLLPPVSRFLFGYFGNTNVNLAKILFAAWLVMTVIKLLHLTWRQIGFRNYLLPFICEEKEAAVRVRKILRELDADKIRIALVPGKLTPSIVGLIHPVLVLPEKEFEEQELRYICEHEVEHYKRHDLWLKFFLNLVICAQWFNPLVYLLDRELTLAFELSTDQAVLERHGEETWNEYASCLIKNAKGNDDSVFGLSFIKIRPENIKTRMRFITSYSAQKNKTKKRTMILRYLFVMAIGVAAVFFVPEAYRVDEVVQGDTFGITEGDSYFVKNGEKYDLYLEGEYVFSVSSIFEEAKDLPIYAEEELK